jgi:type I restriction enzyme, S subunit
MSGMNFLEKLLDGVTAEWKTLGEIGEFTYGYAAKAQDSGDARFVRITDIDINGKLIATDSKYVDISGENERYLLKKDDLLMARTGATYGKTMIFEEDYPAIYAGFLIKLSFDERVIIPKFYWHFAQSNFFWNQANRLVSGGGQPQFNANVLKDVKILIPPLETQAEIVRILDTFTALTAELTAELTDRKKQYNYYRDRLLTFEKGEVEWKTLGEVALDFGRGKSKHRPRNDPKLYGGNNPFIQTGDIRNASHIIEIYSQTYSEIGLKQSKLWPKGTLCITIAANIAETSILGFDACFPDSVIGFVANPEETTSGYVEYLLSSLKTKLEEMGQGSAQSNINMGTFENLRLPFPPLAEQVRIASLLDKFDTLTTSISEGLPLEIALRQKQYEYYRDLLLTFPKSEEVEA